MMDSLPASLKGEGLGVFNAAYVKMLPLVRMVQLMHAFRLHGR